MSHCSCITFLFLIEHIKWKFTMSLVNCKSALLFSLVSELLIPNTETERWCTGLGPLEIIVQIHSDDMESERHWITWVPSRYIAAHSNPTFTQLTVLTLKDKKNTITFWLQWAAVTENKWKFAQIIVGKYWTRLCASSVASEVKQPLLWCINTATLSSAPFWCTESDFFASLALTTQ